MNSQQIKTFLWIALGFAVPVGWFYFYITKAPLDSIPAWFRCVSAIVTIEVVLFYLFSQWAWKWRVFRGWLVKQPDLNGFYKGEILSMWINPDTGKTIDPIPSTLTIKQTFFKISIVVRTGEMVSRSFLACIDCDPEMQHLSLCYNYVSKPKASVEERSKPHHGTAILEVFEETPIALKGDYWTDRKTTGGMNYQKQKKSGQLSKNLPHPMSE